MQQPSLPLTSSGKVVGLPKGLGGFSWQWENLESHWDGKTWHFPLKWLKKRFHRFHPRHSSVSLSASGALVTHGWANKSGNDNAGSFKYIVMRLWNEHGVFTWTLSETYWSIPMSPIKIIPNIVHRQYSADLLNLGCFYTIPNQNRYQENSGNVFEYQLLCRSFLQLYHYRWMFYTFVLVSITEVMSPMATTQ